MVSRVRDHVKRSHVDDFLRLLEKDRTKGVFIHVGRTGKASRNLFRHVSVECVSGDKLVALIKGNAVCVHGARLHALT